MMDEKKIIIMNLSKGRVGEVNANLLGSMLVTKIYLAAMSRADVPARTLSELPSFYFYVDEFQSFANQSFADILSEARKYKLNLIIAHQYIEQMEEEVRDAVFGNVGTTVAFRVGPFDAEVLETIFQPKFTQEDLVNLGFAQIYLTLMIDGVGSPPFSATTMSPFDPPPERFVEQTIESSRLQFGRSRKSVEEALAAWSEPDSMAPKKANPVAAPTQKPAEPAQQRPIGSVEPRPAVAPASAPIVVAPSSATQTRPQTVPVPVRPSAPRPRQPEKPPLGGATSLKEALAMAARGGSSSDEKPVAKSVAEPKTDAEASLRVPNTQTSHQPSLKEALGKIVEEKNHAHLSEQTLRDMLRVDVSGNETE